MLSELSNGGRQGVVNSLCTTVRVAFDGKGKLVHDEHDNSFTTRSTSRCRDGLKHAIVACLNLSGSLSRDFIDEGTVH